MAVAILFPAMYGVRAEKSGMKIPPNPDKFTPEEYPHWAVFLNIHLGKPFRFEDLDRNATIISSIPEDKILTVTMKDLEDLGVHVYPEDILD